MAWIKRHTPWQSLPRQFDPTLQIPGFSIDHAAIAAEIGALAQSVPFHHWRSQAPGALYGMSLSFDPDAPAQEWHCGSFGHPRYHTLPPTEYFTAPERERHTAPRGDYLDSLGFRKRLPEIDRLPALSAIFNRFRMPVVRATLRILDGRKVQPTCNDHGGMHQDDPPEEVLRINICITGSPDFGLQYRGHPPLPAAPGDHRVINSDADHRVWVARQTPLQRIHLVLGLVPWLDYDPRTDTWTPNRHLGKTHPFDLIRAGLAWE
jgi:hypothetical protein